MMSYCRTFIPNYSSLESPLSTIAHGPGVMSESKVAWIPEAETAFEGLKTALLSTPTLGLPDPTQPFTQAVDVKQSYMSSVLLQDHGG